MRQWRRNQGGLQPIILMALDYNLAMLAVFLINFAQSQWNQAFVQEIRIRLP